jgi:hypothetical protein
LIPGHRRALPPAWLSSDFRFSVPQALKVMQEMLGHSGIVLTADIYTSVLPEVPHTAAVKPRAARVQSILRPTPA